MPAPVETSTQNLRYRTNRADSPTRTSRSRESASTSAQIGKGPKEIRTGSQCFDPWKPRRSHPLPTLPADSNTTQSVKRRRLTSLRPADRHNANGAACIAGTIWGRKPERAGCDGGARITPKTTPESLKADNENSEATRTIKEGSLKETPLAESVTRAQSADEMHTKRVTKVLIRRMTGKCKPRILRFSMCNPSASNRSRNVLYPLRGGHVTGDRETAICRFE